MYRHILVLVLGLALSSAAQAATWAEGMFDSLAHDFGFVPRGPQLSHRFTISNNTGRAVTITNVRVSCGCVSAVALANRIQPGQANYLVANMDTTRFTGQKQVVVYVRFEEPAYEEVRLTVQANGRDDVVLTPDTLAFGQVAFGSTPSAKTTLSFLGQANMQIVGVQCETNYLQPIAKETRRDFSTVTYEVSVKARQDLPIGKWFTDVWVKTNNPNLPRIRIPLTIEVTTPVSLSTEKVSFGEVKVGEKTERLLTVRGNQPFRVKAVDGSDEIVNVSYSPSEAKNVHVLKLTLKGEQPGEVKRTFKVVTDEKMSSALEFSVTAQVNR